MLRKKIVLLSCLICTACLNNTTAMAEQMFLDWNTGSGTSWPVFPWNRSTGDDHYAPTDNIRTIDYDIRPARQSDTIESGDVNGDGTVNLTDSILALQVVAGQGSAGIVLDGEAKGDGRIGVAEAVLALRKQLGKRGMKMWKAENSSDPYHAWGTDQVVGVPAKEQEAVQDFLHYKVRRLYASYNKSQSEVAAWNQQLYNVGIDSYITIGDSSYDNSIFPGQRNVILDAIDTQLLTYNNNYATTDAERFVGIRLNLEPQRMDEWDNGTAADRRQLLLYLLETFSDVRAHLDANDGSNLKIFADIGHYFDKMPPPDPANGKVGWTSEQERDQWFSDVSQVLNTVIIMSYGLSVSSVERTTIYERGAMSNSELALNVKDIVSIGTGEDIWQDLDEFIRALEQVEADLTVDAAIHSFRYLKHLMQ